MEDNVQNRQRRGMHNFGFCVMTNVHAAAAGSGCAWEIVDWASISASMRAWHTERTPRNLADLLLARAMLLSNTD